ncbi:MAG: cobalt-precorrin-5B (C(1))-methyltransferase [Candidatus Puniceispirillaceae bacterium]
MADILTSNLRFGWTTGTCATAATMASYTALMTGKFPKNVKIETPSGKVADLAVEMSEFQGGAAIAGIIKDAGDDPDVTHGALISAEVSFGKTGQGIRFLRGKGVGIITKPGLPIEVGEPAINPVPRQMMTDAIAGLSESFGGSIDVDITIHVKDGEAIALKTWNPRLGITGGISILGTSGVVRPFSCSAWIASIHRGIDVARANGIDHVLGATGNRSEHYAKSVYEFEDIACLDMGDFVGGLVKYLRLHPIAKLTLSGGFAKFTKLAQGAIDLHSARSQVDFQKLAQWGASVGMKAQAIETANSALEVLQSADERQKQALCDLVAENAQQTIISMLRGADISVEIMVVSREGTLLARRGA